MAAQSLEIKLKTLTPLWTGGVDGTMDRIHETGIIGSLRWWYEAIVRGLGGAACDPINSKCEYDQKKENDGLCDVCRVFGATGWRRRFRLAISEQQLESDGPKGTKSTTGKRYKRDGKKRPKWYFFNGPGRTGSFDLHITPFHPDFNTQLIAGLMLLISRQANLAAKNQLGYGLVEMSQLPNPVSFLTSLEKNILSQKTPDPALPNLCDMFFAKIEVNQNGITPTLNLKYDIRAAFRSAFNGNQDLRHFICGHVKGNTRQASKIFISQGINNEMRVWGWIPQQLPQGIQVNRNQVVTKINRVVSTFGAIKSWREYNSSRDTLKRENDQKVYLKSLLEE